MNYKKARAWQDIFLFGGAFVAGVGVWGFDSTFLGLLGLAMVLLSILVWWLYYRCPQCHESLGRGNPKHCPHCGAWLGDEPEPEEENSEQFDVSDQRTLDEVVNWLMKMGYIPSFCTACYREGRTGDRFMALCKNMQILNCCHPNALMTLKEYLEDYAGEETKKIGMELIDRELEKIPNPKVKQTAYEHIHDIAEGKRDFRF